MERTDDNVQKRRWTLVPSLSRLIIRLRWAVPLVVLLLAALHQVLLHHLLDLLAPEWHYLTELAVYGSTGSLVAWMGLTWLGRAVGRQEQAQAQQQAAYDDLKHLHQQLLSIHEIGRRIASAADVQEVLELAARAPMHLTGALGSAVVSFDDSQERLNLDMTWGLSDTYVQALRRRIEEGIPATRCRSCTPLQARVGSDCPLFQGLQDLAQTEGIASLVCLPISRQQEREGIISAYFPSPEGPPEEQVRFLNIVATGIAAALEGVRLRSRQMATLYATERVAQMRQDMDALLEHILTTILAAWDAETGAIFLYETQGDTWHVRARRGLGTDLADPRYGLAVRLAEEARKDNHPIIESSLQADDGPTANGTDHLASAVAVPLLAEGDIVGTLFLASARPRAFLPSQEHLLSALANQSALAVRNAQLHLQLGHMAVLEERYRLSREMHDGLAQTLSSLGWRLDHLEMLLDTGRLEMLSTELAEARQTVREAYLDVREAIDGLRLAADHPGGLVAALEKYTADFSVYSGIATEFTGPARGVTLRPEAGLQLLRIAQEALTNVRKHAGARHAWVRLAWADDRLALVIADDGRGFTPSLPRGRHHLGLATMRERAESLDGTFTIATGPDQGTRITVTVPTPPSEG